MSTHKAAGKARQHTSPEGKRLGIKVFEGTKVTPGMILIKQNGTKFHSGQGTKLARDHSVYAVVSGKVEFGQKLGKKVVSVV